MLEISAAALVSRLDEEWTRATRDHGAAPVLAFDADGTLWTGDVGDDFFEALLTRSDVLPAAERAIEAELARAGVSLAEGARASRALFDAYHAGRFDEERFYEVVAWAAAGRTRAEIEAYADRVQAAHGLDDRLQAEVTPILAWANKSGVEVFVVSASPRIVVQRGVKRLGIAPDNVLGAGARWEADVMLPDATRPIPYGRGKVTALRARIGERPILAAFGDNAFDLAMLGESAVPVAVRPKPRLLARTEEIGRIFRLMAPM